jgi:hypothetical protein
VASVVEDSGMPSPPATTAAVEEEWTPMETVAAQASLEQPVGAGSGGADVLMVPSDEDSVPPPPSEEHDVVMTSVPEPSPVAKVLDFSPVTEVPEPSPVV